MSPRAHFMLASRASGANELAAPTSCIPGPAALSRTMVRSAELTHLDICAATESFRKHLLKGLVPFFTSPDGPASLRASIIIVMRGVSAPRHRGGSGPNGSDG